jgi:hypothetical protein
MLRSLAVAAALFALSASAALADGGPGPGVLTGGGGVVSANGAVRWVAVLDNDNRETTVEAVQTAGGKVLQAASLAGSWGIPLVAYDGTAGGLSRNNQTLVLAQANLVQQTSFTRFQIVDPKVLGSIEISLRGSFSYDALSPNGNLLYLIQHVSQKNANAYRVRAYDVANQQLLPGAIADRTQRGWTMQGMPVARTESPNGRFVYTLYQNPGGYPFVHELDTVRATAHCIGVPFTGDQKTFMHATLRLSDGRLAVAVQKGSSYYRYDVRTTTP